MHHAPASTIFALTLLVLAAPSVRSQTQPATAPPADAALAAERVAFLALPQATRKSVQGALVWLGFYNGVIDGDFGKRTRDAIVAFQTSAKAAADGALTPPQLRTLLAAAQKARDAIGFKVIPDSKTGAKAGAPTKLLGGRNGAKLEFSANADPDLAALYARLSAATPSRKIAHKAIKPDVFFVVSGQDGAANFYTRFEKNAGATPPIRGFTFTYPTAQAAQFDRIAIAIANSFEAFPDAAGGAAGSGAAPPAPKPVPVATALVFAPGRALTALKADDCPNPTVNGKPVRLERIEAATNLAIIAGDFAAKGAAPRFSAPGPDDVVLGFAGQPLAVTPASLAGDEARPVVIASVETSGSGGPVFDRRGALVGLVAPVAGEPKRVAGVALAAPHAVIASSAIRAFLGEGEPAAADAADLSAGDIAAREKGALVAVFCQK